MKMLEDSLVKFFSDESNFENLKHLMTNKNAQPRLLDYYVTQYSKNEPEFFIQHDGLHDVYNSYKCHLKGFHKRYFNLFCKKNHIEFKSNGKVIVLPLAKANVYKWMLNCGITSMLETKHKSIQKRYYEFRKNSLSKCNKRGKLSTFLSCPTLVKGVSKGKKKNVSNK
tara:strand:- start:4354 stop:4857 length:504 start_codon:yes stop_codon:yes gene_type:complete